MTTEAHRIIRLKEVLRLCGCSRSTLYEMMERREFPQPVSISQRIVGWHLRDVLEWIESRPLAE